MREILYGTARLSGESGQTLLCQYWIVVQTIEDPICCENYGIMIRIPETGEQERILDLTVRPERIESLAATLLHGGVTPCTLADIVADWL